MALRVSLLKHLLSNVASVILGIAEFKGLDGAGECGKSSPNAEAFRLAA
ncbi:hypothetical protein Acr_24g0012390 [Actinidia rufa]|uniref:Uncharacterized protein n=1 Tax=Actinidia rufa TaxID=165716 RepID=A0A7J0GW36_9ERIC|nr:hypothetical protein Acr_24g0012390 [Actinidia rufa]